MSDVVKGSATTIELEFPVEHGAATYGQLRLRRPKVRDVLAAEKYKGGNAEREIAMFSNLCEIAPDVIEAMDLADYQRLQEAYAGFLPSAQKTAESAA